MKSTVSLTLQRFGPAGATSVTDEVAAEEPLEIRVEGTTLAITMRTPGHDRELAAGFLLAEGIIGSAADVFDITTCVTAGEAGEGNVVDVALRDPAKFDPAAHGRHGVTSASCGVCGKHSIAALLQKRAPLAGDLTVRAEVLLALPSRLMEEQDTFRRTGGLHACALFTREGELVQVREDIGRHNALDKLIGWALLGGTVQLEECLVLLSGRASFEMLQKALAARIPIVAAISAPSSLAVQFARDGGQTLAGFLRGATMNVYVGEQRILFP